ncbi:hypothetical protein H4R33_002647 [Dimargaris cristalligena]|uniref:Superoxide dismutase n=1 Tax=Dimargaris cristalligena TaxID=215637 RepID=A0A4P9ZXH9_9FUNG|nr:hypothetical protein H4R33_002647 [Dimargaris cristalligena]RKP38374.1 superoxide dismutase [Dimargaris cristalligena]|eukprot:RKP38374.1 superoxide dismutase [Dimargaris cristalligena]
MLKNLLVASLALLGTVHIASAHYISKATLTCPTGIKGSLLFDDPHKGYVAVTVEFTNLVADERYNYFIDDHAVPADGDCSKTGNLFDPTKKYKDPNNYSCTADKASKCAKGDLTGRGGVLVGKGIGQTTTLTWHDTQLALRGTNGINGKSVVIYNGSRKLILCANIEKVQ